MVRELRILLIHSMNSYLLSVLGIHMYDILLFITTSPHDPLSLQDQATGGDVYSVVNKKPPPVTPYDPSHEQVSTLIVK